MRIHPEFLRGPAARARALATLAGAFREAIAELSLDAYAARVRLADPAEAAGALPALRLKLDAVIDRYDTLARAAGRPPAARRPE